MKTIIRQAIVASSICLFLLLSIVPITSATPYTASGWISDPAYQNGQQMPIYGIASVATSYSVENGTKVINGDPSVLLAYITNHSDWDRVWQFVDFSYWDFKITSCDHTYSFESGSNSHGVAGGESNVGEPFFDYINGGLYDGIGNWNEWSMVKPSYSDLTYAFYDSTGSRMTRNQCLGGEPEFMIFDWADRNTEKTIIHLRLDNCVPIPTPEPATMFLFGTGLVCLAGMRQRKLKKK